MVASLVASLVRVLFTVVVVVGVVLSLAGVVVSDLLLVSSVPVVVALVAVVVSGVVVSVVLVVAGVVVSVVLVVSVVDVSVVSVVDVSVVVVSTPATQHQNTIILSSHPNLLTTRINNGNYSCITSFKNPGKSSSSYSKFSRSCCCAVKAPKSSHISPILKFLQWLKMSELLNTNFCLLYIKF